MKDLKGNRNEPVNELLVNSRSTIGSIQQEFHKAFPYLKVEFFSRTHQAGKGSAKRYLLHGQHNLTQGGSSGQLAITPDMKVSDLEQRFQQVFGLGVQVFRKSGKVWLETTVTDGWTLDEQNRQGEALARL
jgi:hypothetical protein